MRHLLRLWRSRLLSPSPPAADDHSSARLVVAIRRDWADGTHDHVGPADTSAAAVELHRIQRGSWPCSPWRPVRSMVETSGHDFWPHTRHRPQCKAPDGPTASRAVLA